jgi:hypothetical protein
MLSTVAKRLALYGLAQNRREKLLFCNPHDLAHY